MREIVNARKVLYFGYIWKQFDTHLNDTVDEIKDDETILTDMIDQFNRNNKKVFQHRKNGELEQFKKTGTYRDTLRKLAETSATARMQHVVAIDTWVILWKRSADRYSRNKDNITAPFERAYGEVERQFKPPLEFLNDTSDSDDGFTSDSDEEGDEVMKAKLRYPRHKIDNAIEHVKLISKAIDEGLNVDDDEPTETDNIMERYELQTCYLRNRHEIRRRLDVLMTKTRRKKGNIKTITSCNDALDVFRKMESKEDDDDEKRAFMEKICRMNGAEQDGALASWVLDDEDVEVRPRHSNGRFAPRRGGARRRLSFGHDERSARQGVRRRLSFGPRGVGRKRDDDSSSDDDDSSSDDGMTPLERALADMQDD